MNEQLDEDCLVWIGSRDSTEGNAGTLVSLGSMGILICTPYVVTIWAVLLSHGRYKSPALKPKFTKRKREKDGNK